MPSNLFSGLGDAVTARLVLLANHVIASEPAATQKLQPFAGRDIELRLLAPATRLPVLGDVSRVLAWLPGSVRLRISAAGLLELVPAASAAAAMPGAPEAPGLTLTVHLPDPLAAVRMAVQRQRPEVQIEGDAQLAEAASWLMKNLRWDLEDDLARWLGTPPTQVLKSLADAVGQALARIKDSASRMGAPGR